MRSEAYDYYVNDLRQEPMAKPLPRQTKKVKIRRQVNKKLVFVKWDDKKARISPLRLLTLVFIFCGAISIAVSSAMVKDAHNNITALEKELKRCQDENMSLNAAVADNYNLTEVEAIAIGRLGMERPKPYQIIYIDVPKQSYVVRSKPVEETRHGFRMKDVLGLFRIGG